MENGGKAFISSANPKTRLRSLQRKHTQHSYVLLKKKLLSLVRPIPGTALQAESLEAFRAHLYIAVRAEPELPQPKDNTESILSNVCCNWCGTWMPIPRQNIIAIKDNHPDTDALEATAADELEVTIDADAITSAEIIDTGKEEDSENLGFNNNIGADPPELAHNQLDIFEYLTGRPMLCEVVCNVGGDRAEQDMIRNLRAQRVAALRARWVGRHFNGPPWLSSPHVSTMGQYSTDPNTGECKTQ